MELEIEFLTRDNKLPNYQDGWIGNWRWVNLTQTRCPLGAHQALPTLPGAFPSHT